MKIIIDDNYEKNIRDLRKYKGFVTIATGKKAYKKMANILLNSYKQKTKTPYRFAVITDCEDELIKEFDDIIIYNQAEKTYMDKISLLNFAPYSENIFIDSDCIVYGDLNVYWEKLTNGQNLNAFGRNLDINSNDGWYKVENLDNYKDKVLDIIDIHGGIYYIKNNEESKELYKIAKDIAENYDKYKFNKFKKPADEPILALLMAINGYKTAQSTVSDYVWLKNAKKVRCDFFSGKLKYIFDNKNTEKGLLLHFGTSYTILPLYKVEASKVMFYKKFNRKWNFYETIFNYIKYYICSFFMCGLFVIKKVTKKIKI